MSGTSPGPTKLRSARPKSVMRSPGSADELALGVERAEDRELFLRGWLRGGELGAHQHLEAGVLAHLLDSRARVERQELHPAAFRVEAEDSQRRYHAGDAAEEQAGAPARVAAVEIAGARDEVHPLGEAPFLVDGEDDHLAAERDD